MRWVNTDFKRLQPIGVPQAFESKTVACRGFKAVKRREGWWRFVCIAEPRKQHAALFNHWVAALLDAVAQFATCGLGWRL